VERVLARGPAAHQAAEHQPAEHQPAEHQPAEHQPAEHQPAEHQPAEHQAAEYQAAPHQSGGGDARFDVAFADPPYAMAGEAVTAMLTSLAEAGWLVPGALVVVERSTRSGPLHWPEGYTEDRARRYGEATLWYGLASGALLG
jgi:16S rRNA G966 N2-methylase RsmD